MSAKAETITADRARSVLSYDATSGQFTWLKNGRVAGGVNSRGYVLIRLDGIGLLAHRLAWLFVHGSWPPMSIDHINGDKLDNRALNLRLATVKANAENQTRAHPRNKVGLLGVSLRRGKFRALIQHNGKRMALGTFDTAEAARERYVQVKRVLHKGSTL